VKFDVRCVSRVAITVGLAGVCCLPLAFAQSDGAVGQAELQAREVWRASMHNINAPGRGCFHASYPSTAWEEVECVAAPGYRSALPKEPNREQTAGNGFDYVAQAPSGHTFSSVIGSFTTVTGVTSEKSVGVAAFGDGGILGANEYTLQVNTNFANTAACAGFSGCLAWQQYVLSTNTPVSLTSNQLTGNSEVFIEYWLINYGVHDGNKDICPKGFIDGGADANGPGDDCVQNTSATIVAKGQIPITDLASLTLSGTAKSGGTDAATVTFGTNAYSATVADSLTDIASGWSQAEFNVLGNAGGSEAKFNTGSSIEVHMALAYGSTTSPTCVPPSDIDGTTGETNNLTLGACNKGGGSTPHIRFAETH
jgi:hypothetical protein